MKKRFITAKNDRVFRSIFVDEEDHSLLEGLLSTCLQKEVKIIKILKTELSVKSVKERVKRLDLVVEAEGEKINVELNTSYGLITKVRNLNYFTAFYSENTTIGEEYDYKTNFIHLDLSYGMGKEKPIMDTYFITSNETKENYIDNFQIIVYNMDKIMEFWYDKDKKGIKKYELLIMLDLLPKELELLKRNGDNRLVKEYEQKVKKLNEDLDFIAPLSAEEDYIALMNTEKKYLIEESMEQGFEKGIEQGVEQGMEQGSKKEKIEIAKKLLEEKVDINIISKTTGLTIEELKTIR